MIRGSRPGLVACRLVILNGFLPGLGRLRDAIQLFREQILALMLQVFGLCLHVGLDLIGLGFDLRHCIFNDLVCMIAQIYGSSPNFSSRPLPGLGRQ